MKKTLAIILTLALVLCLCACGGTKAEDKTITVGASSTPHAEILEQVKDALAKEGYELKIVVYDDYVLPNQALSDGTLDANYFQHSPYLNSYNASEGTDLISAALIHYEPFGIYGNGVTDLAQLAAGATILIPADDSNETRALLLLQQEGFTNALKGEVMEMAGRAQKTSAIVESSGSGMRMNLQFFGGGNSMDLEMEQMPSLLPQTYTADLSNVTGKGADARNRAIMAIIKEDFPDLKLTFIPEYSPFIRTGVAQRNTGTQIGKRMFSSRAELRDTIIHEELHHRWWKRGIIDHHPMNSAKEELFYKTIAEYKKMRGWD